MAPRHASMMDRADGPVAKDLLQRVADEPALVQLAVVGLLALLAATLWLRASRRIRGSAGRQQLRDYLLGVEQYLSGDASGALRRFDAVVEADPGHLEARLFRALALTASGRGQEAHREHVHLERSGSLSTAWNRAGLMRALFEAGLESGQAEVPVDLLPVPSPTGVEERLVPVVASVSASPLPERAVALRALESAVRCADAIESNRAHLLRLAGAVEEGDSAAVEECVDLGAAAVPVVFERLVDPSCRVSTEFCSILVRMGATQVDAVVEAWRDGRGEPGERNAALARYGIALGSAGLPRLRELLASADRDLRKVVLDVHLAIADLGALDEVLEVCAPVEVLQRLNHIDHESLVRVLAGLPAGHVLLDVHLVDAAFAREEAVLDAAARIADPAPLENLLVQRGASSAQAARAAISRLGLATTAPSARRVLARLGGGVREHLIAAYADLDQAAEIRSEVRRCLLDSGPTVVPTLCDAFGTVPAPTDADLLELLVDFGAAAVPMLVDAYRAGGWFERLARPLRKRRTHRRDSIVRVLRRIGGVSGEAALQDLRSRETDHDLALRIAQALHALADESTDRDEPGGLGRGGSVAGA